MQPDKDYTKKNDPLRVKRTLVLVGWKNPESLEKVDRQHTSSIFLPTVDWKLELFFSDKFQPNR